MDLNNDLNVDGSITASGRLGGGGGRMIVREFYRTRNDGVNLYRTYSDAGFMLIRNDGVEYDEAIDVEDAPYTYTESTNKVEVIEAP